MMMCPAVLVLGAVAVGETYPREPPPATSLANLAVEYGTLGVEREKFEPRVAPMELRRIDKHTVELYQPATPNWKLESCGRYHLLPDGTIEYTFECIPRADVFRNGYTGLFRASDIDGPEDRAISFRGHEGGCPQDVGWIRSVSPRHGTDATHPPAGALPKLTIDPEFPLRLVSGRSSYRHTEPWYYGVCRGMALVHSFRDGDGIWFAQSPTGGGADNPAWDFQWFIPDYEVGRAYGFRIRMAYVPFESRDQIAALARRHVRELNQK